MGLAGALGIPTLRAAVDSSRPRRLLHIVQEIAEVSSMESRAFAIIFIIKVFFIFWFLFFCFSGDFLKIFSLTKRPVGEYFFGGEFLSKAKYLFLASLEGLKGDYFKVPDLVGSSKIDKVKGNHRFGNLVPLTKVGLRYPKGQMKWFYTQAALRSC